MRTALLTFLLASLLLGGAGCTAIARWYTRHVAHTTDLDSEAPDPSQFSPIPPAPTNRPALQLRVAPKTMGLAWDPSGRRVAYDVQETQDFCNWTTVQSTTNTTCVVTNDKPHSFFRVGAHWDLTQ